MKKKTAGHLLCICTLYLCIRSSPERIWDLANIWDSAHPRGSCGFTYVVIIHYSEQERSFYRMYTPPGILVVHQIAALATWTLLTLNPKFVQNPTFPLQTPCSGGKLKVTVNTAYKSCRHTRQLQSRQFDTVLRSTNVRHDINTLFCFCIALSLCRLTQKKITSPAVQSRVWDSALHYRYSYLK